MPYLCGDCNLWHARWEDSCQRCGGKVRWMPNQQQRAWDKRQPRYSQGSWNNRRPYAIDSHGNLDAWQGARSSGPAKSNWLPKQCTSCSLFNLSSSTQCARCHTPLSAAPAQSASDDKSPFQVNDENASSEHMFGAPSEKLEFEEVEPPRPQRKLVSSRSPFQPGAYAMTLDDEKVCRANGICMNLNRGNCSRGARCSYAHDIVRQTKNYPNAVLGGRICSKCRFLCSTGDSFCRACGDNLSENAPKLYPDRKMTYGDAFAFDSDERRTKFLASVDIRDYAYTGSATSSALELETYIAECIDQELQAQFVRDASEFFRKDICDCRQKAELQLMQKRQSNQPRSDRAQQEEQQQNTNALLEVVKGIDKANSEQHGQLPQEISQMLKTLCSALQNLQTPVTTVPPTQQNHRPHAQPKKQASSSTSNVSPA